LVNGVTVGMTIAGKHFPLEEQVRKMSLRANCLVLSLLDCCRQIPPVLEKGSDSIGKTFGQLHIIHAVGPGKSAVTRTASNDLSEVTGEFLKLMKSTNETYPSCLELWCNNHRTVETVKHMPFEFPLIDGSQPRKKGVISTKKFDDWDCSTIVEWLNSLKLSQSYKDHIMENKIDGATIVAIYTDKGWKEAGFSVFGDEIKLKAAIKGLVGY